ncbi:hypothetical protein BGX20_006462, partial [Mortierella sp. AD010]
MGVVFEGDFRQSPSLLYLEDPRYRSKTPASKIRLESVETLKLPENMRFKQNPQNQPFTRYLLSVRDGRKPKEKLKSHRDYAKTPDEKYRQGKGLARL